MASIYDQWGDFYFDFVQAALADPYSVLSLTTRRLLALADPLDGVAVCDMACGEGHLSRAMARRGAKVTGVDLSQNLLAHARRQSVGWSITYHHGDVQALTQLAASSFGLVVCSMALMDIPDLDKTFAMAARMLESGGRFIFSVLHPCFETPFYLPEETPLEVDAAGNFVACRTLHYATEGPWKSGGDGMRGTHGAQHRRLSTYLNALTAHGLTFVHMEEPLLPPGDYGIPAHQRAVEIPRTLIILAKKQR